MVKLGAPRQEYSGSLADEHGAFPCNDRLPAGTIALAGAGSVTRDGRGEKSATLASGTYLRGVVMIGIERAKEYYVLAFLLGALCAVGCGKPGTKVPVSEMTAMTNAQGVQVVDVDVHSFYFKPSRIVVESGKPVELVLHFQSFFVPHNFTCMSPEAGIWVSKGAGFMSLHRTKRATFIPTKPGEYEFHCHVAHHHEKGMVGTIVVRKARPGRAATGPRHGTHHHSTGHSGHSR